MCQELHTPQDWDPVMSGAVQTQFLSPNARELGIRHNSEAVKYTEPRPTYTPHNRYTELTIHLHTHTSHAPNPHLLLIHTHTSCPSHTNHAHDSFTWPINTQTPLAAYTHSYTHTCFSFHAHILYAYEPSLPFIHTQPSHTLGTWKLCSLLVHTHSPYSHINKLQAHTILSHAYTHIHTFI